MHLSVWWGRIGGEGPGRFFAATTPTSEVGIAARLPLPAGEATTVVVDNRFAQADNPPIRGAVCTDDAGTVIDGRAFNDDGALEFEVASPATIARDIYLVPSGANGNGAAPVEASKGSPDAAGYRHRLGPRRPGGSTGGLAGEEAGLDPHGTAG
ncbi:MAG: hypothetical protein ACRDJW_24275 [Thermomicrobiales bacterium]